MAENDTKSLQGSRGHRYLEITPTNVHNTYWNNNKSARAERERAHIERATREFKIDCDCGGALGPIEGEYQLVSGAMSGHFVVVCEDCWRVGRPAEKVCNVCNECESDMMNDWTRIDQNVSDIFLPICVVIKMMRGQRVRARALRGKGVEKVESNERNQIEYSEATARHWILARFALEEKP